MRTINGIVFESINYTMTKSEYITRVVSAMFSFLLLLSISVYGQSVRDPLEQTAVLGRGGNTPVENNVMLTAFPYKGETLPLVKLKDFNVVAIRTFKSETDRQSYFRLTRNVRKVYPYAILASVKLRECDAILANMPENKRSPYLKKAEKELKVQFESDLKKLTMTQGKILIRLINRETGMTTYKVIKDYRGSFSAFVWQSFGRLWGNNLKWKYDPTQGEDMLIEEIIQQIQDGEV